MGEARPNHKTLVPFKAFLFPYACLSRACLGKPSLFIYSQDKWLAIIMQKRKERGTFSFHYPHRCRAFSASRSAFFESFSSRFSSLHARKQTVFSDF
jgi:hypothetical protein